MFKNDNEQTYWEIKSAKTWRISFVKIKKAGSKHKQFIRVVY